MYGGKGREINRLRLSGQVEKVTTLGSTFLDEASRDSSLAKGNRNAFIYAEVVQPEVLTNI